MLLVVNNGGDAQFKGRVKGKKVLGMEETVLRKQLGGTSWPLWGSVQ